MSKVKNILEKFGLREEDNRSFNVLVTSLKVILELSNEKKLKSLQNIDAPLLSLIKELSDNEIQYLEQEIIINSDTIEECQVLVQKLLPKQKRKELAAYYTVDRGVKLMASIVKEYIVKSEKNEFVIADPFLGSARTLTSALETIGTNKIRYIWGIEPYPLAALVAYAALLRIIGGKKDMIKVVSGDAFKEISKEFLIPPDKKMYKADIIITNPPFTRWEYLGNNYQQKIFKIIESIGYSKYITRKQTSLQILSMFLIDYVLNRNGLVISVLPASTFYTIYGRGYKELIKKNYHLLSFLESGSQSSFSIDSGFKEVIIIGIKKFYSEALTLFGGINGITIQEFAQQLINLNLEKIMEKNEFSLININKIPNFIDNNWLSLVGNKQLKELMIDTITNGIKKNILGIWEEILGSDTIIRGIEMYGPDFFFIGNKYWDIIQDLDKYAEIKNKETNEILKIDKKFLVKTLRKPSLYNYYISLKVDTYMISIPPKEIDEFPRDLKAYINWGKISKTAKPAIRKHKKFWYSHVYYQVQSKDPYGFVFTTDKLDLGFVNRGVFANYSKEKLAASKNFYILKNINYKNSILLTAWFNSTFFISILVLFSRKISDTWTRFLINDYLEFPILNINDISDEIFKEISECIYDLLDKKLVPFWEQIGKSYRLDLDLSIAKALKIHNPEEFVNMLYNNLINYYQSLRL